MTTIGILHPGEMGAEVGAVLREAGHEVLWVAAGRSEATVERAACAGLRAVGSATELAARCEVILSICPPHAAAEVANEIEGFAGVFVESNAISAKRTREIAAMPALARCEYVDGGIIGPPPARAGSTRLWLSGGPTDRVAGLFTGARLQAVVAGGEVGRASALKMAYAAWTKGRISLLLAARALAEAEGVGAELRTEWELSQPEAIAMLPGAEAAASGKGWRWVAEMEQIASSFERNGLPGGFHRAAASVYESPARFVGGLEVDEG